MSIDAAGPRMQSVQEHGHVAQARFDGAALGAMYDSYLPRIYAYIARRVGDRDAVEDLTAATFVRALGAIRDDEVTNAELAGFLYRVAARAVTDHVRRSRKSIPRGIRASDLDEGDDDRASAESIGEELASRAFAAAIDGDRMRRAILRLPDVHRRVIVLTYFDGLEVDEVCAALACSRQAFAVAMHRALGALRASLDQQAPDAA